MQFFVLLVFVGVTSAARLENTYLPPSNAKTAGGDGNTLGAPSGGYGVPSNGHDDGKYTIASVAQQHDASTFKSRQPSFAQNGHHQQGSAFSALVKLGAPSATYGAPAQRGNGLSANYGDPQKSQQPSPVYGPASGVSSRATSADARANTLRFDNDNDGTGNYHFEYETENKISQQEQGQLKNVAEGEAVVVQGSYSYVGDDGKTYTVTYIADENGFQPTGEHIDQAISMAASDAARSAGSEGQQGYNYNAQQGHDGQQAHNVQTVHQGQQSNNGGYKY